MAAPQFLAVGDIQGILHIMEIPRSLRRVSYKEVRHLSLSGMRVRKRYFKTDSRHTSHHMATIQSLLSEDHVSPYLTYATDQHNTRRSQMCRRQV